MIRLCAENDFDEMYEIINDSAEAYRSVLPPDCWKEPYMPEGELRHEIKSGVVFYGYEDNGELLGVMGMQFVRDVTLIRHAYVRTDCRRHGVGGKLLAHLYNEAKRPVLVGTWRDAAWAVRFYENHGFKLVSEDEKNKLLKQYWSIPRRQIETSVVLADTAWFNR